MPSANIAAPSPRLAAVKCASSYGRIFWLISRAIWFQSGSVAGNHARSNAAPNLTPCLTNLAKALWKSPIATVTGKAGPAIIEVLTKCHSGQTQAKIKSLGVLSQSLVFQLGIIALLNIGNGVQAQIIQTQSIRL